MCPRRLRFFLYSSLLSGLAAAASGQDNALADALAKAPALTVEKVCAPIRSSRGGSPEWVPNPDGKSYDLLIRYFDTYYGPHTTVILDLGAGTATTHTRPTGTLMGTGFLAPDGRLFTPISAKGGTGFQVYEPSRNQIRDLAAIAPNVGGETKPLCVGPDGMIYGAGSESSRRAICYQIDPKTETITSYGPVGPSHAPNGCWGYYVAADTRYVYVSSGKIPWYLVAYDRETGQDAVLLTLDDPTGSISLGQIRGCPFATVRHSGGKPWESYWLVNGKPVPQKEGNEAPPVVHPYPAPPAAPIRPTRTGDLEPLADGKVSLALQMPGDTNGATRQTFAFTVPTYPANVYQIAALPDGRICGSGGNYLGLFVYDPKLDRHEHLGRLPVSMPILAWHDGLLYLSGYPSTTTMAYDPAQPWSKTNPAFLGYLNSAGSGTHTILGMGVAADGKVYMCGKWHRNGEGGGLAWWDPKSRQPGGFHDGMGHYQTTHLAITGQGRYVVLSSRAVRDHAKPDEPTPGQGRIFVYDTAERQLTHFDPLPGGIHAGAIAGATGTLVVALAPDPSDTSTNWTHRRSLLYAFDARTGAVAWKKPLPAPAGFTISENFDAAINFDFRTGPDGFIWTFTGGRMLAVNPDKPWGVSCEEAVLVRIAPADGAIIPVGKVGRAGRLAFQGNDLYLSGGSKYHTVDANYLRRIRNVVAVP